MNERLKQIMLEHGLHKHISEDCQHRMEMLYELIIKECGVALSPMLRDMISRGQAVDLINKHFEVEE